MKKKCEKFYQLTPILLGLGILQHTSLGQGSGGDMCPSFLKNLHKIMRVNNELCQFPSTMFKD